MISILMDSDFKFEQDLRELLMAFYPGESFTYEEDEASLLSVYVRGGSLEIRKEGEAQVQACASPVLFPDVMLDQKTQGSFSIFISIKINSKSG